MSERERREWRHTTECRVSVWNTGTDPGMELVMGPSDTATSEECVGRWGREAVMRSARES